MKRLVRMFGYVSGAALALGLSAAVPVAPAFASLPVFDVANYSQNLLTAARALSQINNQIQSLQNEAAMLQNMAKNLQKLDFPQLAKINSAMRQINQLMGQAQGIEFKVAGLDAKVKSLFPGVLARALTSDQRAASARAQLDAATAAYKQAMRVQAQVAENVEADAGTFSDLAASSQGSVGALQAEQAANQLIALSVKQQLQLQNLMASEYREAAIDRARRAQAEEDGRALTRRFLGAGEASGN